MHDTDFDTRLREGAPNLASPTPNSLAEHRARILKEARGRRGRRLRVWAASAAASVLIIGGGSVAMAGGGNETPWGWVADNVFAIDRQDGAVCFQGFLVKWEGLAEDDPIVVDAKAIVSGMDLDGLDTTAKEAELRAEYAASVDERGESSPIVVSDDQLRQDAIFQIVAEELWTVMAERGHEMRPGHEVSLSAQGSVCE